jgi:hypothetical protein
MGEVKSPRITYNDVKAHFRYVREQRKLKAKRKWALVRGKAIDRAQVTARQIADKLPFKIIWKGHEVPDMSWLSAQDLYLDNAVGIPSTSGYKPKARYPISPADRGDAPLPVYSARKREMLSSTCGKLSP